MSWREQQVSKETGRDTTPEQWIIGGLKDCWNGGGEMTSKGERGFYRCERRRTESNGLTWEKPTSSSG